MADAVDHVGVVFLDDPREAFDDPDRRAQVVRDERAERLVFGVARRRWRGPRGGRARRGGRGRGRCGGRGGRRCRRRRHVDAFAQAAEIADEAAVRVAQRPAAQAKRARRRLPLGSGDVDVVERGAVAHGGFELRRSGAVEVAPEGREGVAVGGLGAAGRGAQGNEPVRGIGLPLPDVEDLVQGGLPRLPVVPCVRMRAVAAPDPCRGQGGDPARHGQAENDRQAELERGHRGAANSTAALVGGRAAAKRESRRSGIRGRL